MFPREEVSRDAFENLLRALAGAGLIRLEELTFEKDDRRIAYRKASLTREGEELPANDPLDFVLPESLEQAVPARRKSRSSRSAAPAASKTTSTLPPRADTREMPAHAAEIEEKLRTWRLSQARKHGVPAFCILGNQTIRAIAQERPITVEELLSVRGVGPAKAENFAGNLQNLCPGLALPRSRQHSIGLQSPFAPSRHASWTNCQDAVGSCGYATRGIARHGLPWDWRCAGGGNRSDGSFPSGRSTF